MATQQQVVNARTGKTERVFVNLEAVYPNPSDLSEEYSFEELRARHRGWLSKQWKPAKQNSQQEPGLKNEYDVDIPRETIVNATENATVDSSQQSLAADAIGADQTLSDITRDVSRDGKSTRPRRKKIREIKGETQTSMMIRRQTSINANRHPSQN